MINSFDTFFYHLINQVLTNQYLDILMLKFSDKLFWIPLYLLMIVMLIRKYGKQSLLIILFLFLCVFAADRLTSGLLKPLIKRQRPCLEASMHYRDIGEPCNNTGSMPSSHAANHFAIAVFIILLYGIKRKDILIFWSSWAFLIAYSRVYCGVHYPTDVITGSALGILIGIACNNLYQLVSSKIKWS